MAGGKGVHSREHRDGRESSYSSLSPASFAPSVVSSYALAA